MVSDLQSPFFEVLEFVQMRLQLQILGFHHIVKHDVERPTSHLARRQPSQDTSHRVPGVGVRIFVLLDPVLVHFAEIVFGDVHLTANGQQARDVCRVSQSHRHGANRFDILRDVFAELTIASSCRAQEFALAVDQFDRDAVKLRFRDEHDLLASSSLLHRIAELGNFLLVQSCLETEHWRRMLDARQLVDRFCADSPRGGGFRLKVRKCFLQILQAAEQLVVPFVRDLRFVLRVIQVVVMLDRFAKRGDLLSSLLFLQLVVSTHGNSHSRRSNDRRSLHFRVLITSSASNQPRRAWPIPYRMNCRSVV